MTDDSKYTRQTVTQIHTWVPDKLFSVRVTRDDAYTFLPGQFARVGLPGADAPDGPPTLWRAYSMVSAPQESGLEFYSIVVPDGLFSPRMAQLRPGDALYVEKTPYGFLTLERFAPGGDLWLLASGTGLSAYLSILRVIFHDFHFSCHIPSPIVVISKFSTFFSFTRHISPPKLCISHFP